MSNLTRYRVWPDGTVQEADLPAHHWKSDDYELVEAPTPEDAWARAKANAPAVPQDMRLVPVNLLQELESSMYALGQGLDFTSVEADRYSRLREVIAATPAPAPAQEVGLTDDQADAVSRALRQAWQLGQTYWQQADSNFTSEHKKSDETQRDFEKFCDDTIAALRAKGGK